MHVTADAMSAPIDCAMSAPIADAMSAPIVCSHSLATQAKRLQARCVIRCLLNLRPRENRGVFNAY
jgi:hypothetical protein